MENLLGLLLTFLVFAQACTKPDDNPSPFEVDASAILVLNEGLFRRGNATITAYDALSNTSLGTVYNPNGGLDILQSATVLGDTLALVANNSNSLVLLQKESLAEIGRFEALGSPRYLTRMKNGHLLVTDLFSNRLLELNADFSVARVTQQEGQCEASIAFREGALFTSPSRRSVFYYDAILGEVTDSFAVAFRANAIIALDENRVAVCGGILEQGESGGLAILDWSSGRVEFLYSFSESESSLYPRLAISETQLYCLQRDLFYVPLNDLSPAALERKPLTGFADPYGLGLDPLNGDVYISDAKNGLNLGEVVRFNSDLRPLDTFDVGIFPNGFVFR